MPGCLSTAGTGSLSGIGDKKAGGFRSLRRPAFAVRPLAAGYSPVAPILPLSQGRIVCPWEEMMMQTLGECNGRERCRRPPQRPVSPAANVLVSDYAEPPARRASLSLSV